jgi:chorismate mutase
MRTNKQKMVFLATLTVCAGRTSYPQSAADELMQLVEICARRLAVAERVALAKWDSGAPVEDTSREDHVIVTATKDGQSRGLDPISIGNFFRAQVEANKLVQYSLLAEWRRVGKAPDHPPVNLANTIRPELDEVDKALIAEFEKSAAARAMASCPIEIARAVGRFVSAQKNKLGSLRAIALDRALANACTGPRYGNEIDQRPQ